MNSFDQRMPKPLNRDYDGTGLRQPKGRKPPVRERPAAGESGTLSLASLITGIASLALLFAPIPFNFLIALACGIAAVVTGKKAKDSEGVNGMNKAGFVCGIIGLVLIGLLLVLLIALFAMGAAMIDSMGGFSGIQDMFGSMFAGMGSAVGGYNPPDAHAEGVSLFDY